jgi:DNA-binding CsgD family transcriptional regulator
MTHSRNMSETLPVERPDSATRSRQDQILDLAAQGCTDKEIAARLTLSPETIGTYWRRILGKYGASSRTEVVAKVVRHEMQARLDRLSDANASLRAVIDHIAEDRDSLNQRSIAETLVAEIPDLLWVLDDDGRIAYANRLDVRFPFAIGDSAAHVFALSDRERVAAAIRHTARMKAPSRYFTVHIRRAAGGDQAVHLRTIPSETLTLGEVVVQICEI